MSSSGHLALVGRLLGRGYAELPGEARKSVEVALHAGSLPVLAAAAVSLGALADERPAPALLALTALPAGVARMPFWRFSALTLAGCIPWVLLLTFIGKQAGDNWESWKDSLHYVDYAVAAGIVIGVIYLVVRSRRRRGGSPAAESA